MTQERAERAIEWGIVALAAMLPFSAMWVINGYPVPISTIWTALLVTAAGVALVAAIISGRFGPLVQGGSAWLPISAGVFCALCAAGIVVAVDPALWAKELAQMLLFFGMALTVWLFALRRLRMETYSYVVLISAVAVSLLGIAQYLWGAEMGITMFPTEGGRTRAFGGLYYPNKLGAYLAGVIPLGAALACQGGRNGRRFFLMTAAMAPALVFTLSRSGWLACLFGLAVVLLRLKRQAIRPVAGILLMALLCGAALMADTRHRAHAGKLPKKPKHASQQIIAIHRDVDSNRMMLLKIGMERIATAPLSPGVGLGNAERVIKPAVARFVADWPESLRQDMAGAGSFHNTPLQLWVEVSIFGLLAALAAVFFYVRSAFKAQVSDSVTFIHTGLLACSLAVMATGAFDWLFTRGTGDLLFLSAGLLLALQRKERDADRPGT